MRKLADLPRDMCIEAMKWVLAQRGKVSPFGVDGTFVLSSEPQPAAEPPTDADFEQLLEELRPGGEPD
jgi:hypothetical protein